MRSSEALPQALRQFAGDECGVGMEAESYHERRTARARDAK